jgi:ribose-phosphate pyrophosphokinase
MLNEIKIFSGMSNIPLAQDVATELNLQLGDIYHHRFPSGEIYCQYKQNVRGKDLFLMQGMDGCRQANDSLMQLLIMADAARRASVSRIVAVLPMSFYTRQDRKDKSRVPISSKLFLDLVTAAGIDRILTMDLHSPQTCGFTNLPFDHLSFQPRLVRYIKKSFEPGSYVIVAPDVGAVKRAEKYAELLNCDFGFVRKKRIDDNTVSLQSFVGDVEGKDVIIIDDLTESCGTLIQAVNVCKSFGARKAHCAVTHACFTEVGKQRITQELKENISSFIHSSTVDSQWGDTKKPSNLVCLNVAEIFAKAINNIHHNKSVSELFI